MPRLATSKALTFFKEAFTQGVFGHAYLLTGQDTQYQYDIAMHLAQLLNCEAPTTDDIGSPAPCETCRSCKWIATGSHPIVKVVSRLTFEDDESYASKPKASRDKDRTQIATAQVKSLQNYLSRQAGMNEHRVIIFTDVEKVKASERPESESSTGVYPLPFEWLNEPKNKAFTLQWQPLTQGVFNEASANRFLKSLEEPHPRTHYFFLTRNAESLLPTIVSRCQTIYVPNITGNAMPSVVLPDALNQWINHAFYNCNPLDVQPLSQELEALFKESGMLPLQACRLLQQALQENRFKDDTTRYVRWQQALAKMERYLKQSCNPANTMWGLLDAVV
jgi:DNA polymerase III delta prime subunit